MKLNKYKIIIIFAITVAFFVITGIETIAGSLTSMEQQQIEIPSADTDAWNGAEGKRDGKPTLLRFRPNLQKFLGDKRYPRRLTITWDYGNNNSSGMPSNDQSNEMREFEDSIVGALDHDRFAILSFVFTGLGSREWHYYVSDSGDLGNRINTALVDKPGLPISMEIEDDPEWSELRQVFAACK